MSGYSIEMIDGGEISIGVLGDYPTDIDALHWAHYWLGYYRSDSVRLYRGLYVDVVPGADAELIHEIFRP
jgi:hypothetical protein